MNEKIKKIIQDLKVKLKKDIEPLMKNQTEIDLEMKSSGSQSKGSEVSLTNGWKDIEDRISDLPYKAEKK